MKTALRLTFITLLLAVSSLSAATHYVSLGSSNPTPPYTNWVTAATNIQQAVGAAAAGDVVVVTNGVYPGGLAVDKPLTLRSVNGPQPTVIDGGATNQCASLATGASLSGFTLSNGYSYGGDGGGVWCASVNAFLTNCVIVGNSAMLTGTGNGGNGGGAYGGTLYNCTLTGNSVSGTYNSAIRAYSCGGGAFGCILYNCTLAANNGHYGGGAYWGTLYNCTLTGNHAAIGGGAFASVLYNCTLTGNSAVYDQNGGYGGGAYGSGLNNCTLTGNSAPFGGGVYGNGPNTPSMIYNCIVYSNTCTSYNENYDPYTCTLSNCCTMPLPANGGDNITNAPLFVDYAKGNLRLQSNSPCINAGNNAYVSTTDLDGRPRIVGGTVDMGAYEFQPGVSGAFIGWLQQYALPTDGTADYADADADGLNNWQEWVCGTNPTNRLSVLRLLSPSITSTNATVTWQSVAGVNYFLGRGANVASPFTLLATNIIGQAGTTTYAVGNATGTGPFFYRVGVGK